MSTNTTTAANAGSSSTSSSSMRSMTTTTSTTLTALVEWFQINGSGFVPSARYSHVSSTDAGRFWVFGGTDHLGVDKSDLWHYTLEVGWTLADAASGPAARWMHSAAAADGRFWVFGGYARSPASLFGDLWCFENEAWSKIEGTPSPSARFGHVSAMALTRFWVFGGNDFRISGLNDLWYFTPEVGWAQAFGPGDGSVWPSARQVAGVGADRDGGLWIFGGENAPFNQPFMSNDLWHFTLQAGWRLLDAGSGPSVRGGCSSAMDASGKFWVFGGFDYATILNDLWFFKEECR
ncbi:tea1 [Symbiodinium natans]|uniref:Tea1 protein n=1 Tax=Symbiodinium natans TaxID=878477 RepID=A0A812L328_9DINO|nr:tea1 [Symbiodinium natans]